jgi:transposase
MVEEIFIARSQSRSYRYAVLFHDLHWRKALESRKNGGPPKPSTRSLGSAWQHVIGGLFTPYFCPWLNASLAFTSTCHYYSRTAASSKRTFEDLQYGCAQLPRLSDSL